MNQKPSPKIQRVINQRLNIDNPKKIHLLSKNHYTKVNSIRYHPDVGDKLDGMYSYFDINAVLTKLFEKIKVKPVKKLDLKGGYFSLLNENYPRMIKLIKKYSDIQELILLPRLYDDDNNGWEKRTYWLKYAKKLKRVEFTCFGDGNEQIYRNYLRSLRGSRLVSLCLGSYDNEPKETCSFSNYPKTLKNLSLENVSSLSSLHQLKNLEYLYLKVSTVSNDLIEPQMVSWLRKLKYIEFEVLDFSKNSLSLLKSLSTGNNLKSLVFECKRKRDEDFLSYFYDFDYYSLEKLSLVITFDSNLETDLLFLQRLPQKISKLTNLRDLQLQFNNIGINKTQKSNKVTQYIPFSFQDSIEKLTSLEKLSITSMNGELNPLILFEIISLCKQIPTLKKLDLFVEWVVLLEHSCHELCMMIRNLKNLQVLKLPNLIVPGSKLLRALTQSIIERGILKRLHIGQLLDSIPNDVLITNLVELLSLKGLKELKIERDRNDILFKGYRRVQVLNKIMDGIERANPELQIGKIYRDFTDARGDKNTILWKKLFLGYGISHFEFEVSF